MKIKFVLYIFVFFGVVMMLTANAETKKDRVRVLFNINQAYCAIKTNSVTGFTNRDSASEGRGGGISSTNALMLMENGINEISLEFGSLGWFSDGNSFRDKLEYFNPQAECSLDLVRFHEGEEQIISSMKVVVNNSGQPEALNDNNHPVSKLKVLAEQIVPGHIDSDYYDSNYYPKGMALYRFTQSVAISGIPEWPWVRAQVFTGADNQIKDLKSAYIEMAEIIKSRSRLNLKEFNKVALEAWSETTGESKDDILYSLYPVNKLEGGGAKLLPIKWDDYDIRVMNKGRMVQFYNKSNPEYSPLTYRYIDEDGDECLGFFAPIFSLINGKFVPVI
ncbi:MULTISPECIES: hypothetical protein [Enterobacterales]|uniref:hypothetical protein n=1 Tax=Enterobacterales TaxID=91347 RepID=UPI002EDA52DD